VTLRPGQPESSPRDNDLSTTRSLLWTIYEFVTGDAVARANDVADMIDIKHNQVSARRRLERIEQAVTEVRGGIQTMVGIAQQAKLTRRLVA
jgi:Mn-dependent DtxR family transcriptional regulator